MELIHTQILRNKESTSDLECQKRLEDNITIRALLSNCGENYVTVGRIGSSGDRAGNKGVTTRVRQK